VQKGEVNEPPSLTKMLQVKEGQLRSNLEEARATFSHQGDKGDHVEGAVRQFLRDHLPRRFGIGEGEVIDTRARRSGQLDVVISDEQQPFSFPEGSPGLYLVEGVAAVCDVKSVFTTAELQDVVDKAHLFKTLEKQQALGELAIGRNPATDRFYHRPPFFVVAFDNNVQPQTIVNRLRDSDLGDENLHGGVDALFVLGQGSAINLGDGTDQLQIKSPEGDFLRGWAWSPSETVLAHLLLWLASTERRSIRPVSPIIPYLSEWTALRGFILPSA
jgi:hypothetical protein